MGLAKEERGEEEELRGKEDAKVADKKKERVKRVCFPSFQEKKYSLSYSNMTQT